MDRGKQLETILVLVLALGVFYWFNRSEYILLAAGILAFSGLFVPYLARKIHWGWMKLALLLGSAMGKVLLTLVFVLFVLPLSFLSKLFRNKNGVLLHRKPDTYFVERNFTYTKDSIENVW